MPAGRGRLACKKLDSTVHMPTRDAVKAPGGGAGSRAMWRIVSTRLSSQGKVLWLIAHLHQKDQHAQQGVAYSSKHSTATDSADKKR